MSEASRDWAEWHRRYDDPTSSLARRLSAVQRELRSALDSHIGTVRLVSMCAGQGRDVVPVLSASPRCHDVEAVLVEFDPRNSEIANRIARENGLDNVRVIQADAGLSDTYVDAAPADIVLACGMFGNIADEDVRQTIEYLPCLCTAGATVIWTRDREEHRDFAQEVRAAFEAGGFVETAFEAPDDAKYRVGVCRMTAPPRTLKRGARMFQFVR